MVADKQLTRMIEKGKPLSVIRKKVEALALAEDKRAFDVAIRDEYYALFPTYRDATEEERLAEYVLYSEMVEATNATLVEYADFIADKVLVDYSEDETYLTLQEYMDETRVVTEAVEATHDEDGMVLTEAVAEVTEQVRPYIANDVADIVDAYVNGLYKELRAKEYPPIADYVDAVVKDDTEAIEAYIEACLAVKAKYPKV